MLIGGEPVEIQQELPARRGAGVVRDARAPPDSLRVLCVLPEVEDILVIEVAVRDAIGRIHHLEQRLVILLVSPESACRMAIGFCILCPAPTPAALRRGCLPATGTDRHCPAASASFVTPAAPALRPADAQRRCTPASINTLGQRRALTTPPRPVAGCDRRSTASNRARRPKETSWTRSVDEKCRRAAHAAVETALQLLTHALPIDLVVHLGRETCHVEAQPRGVSVQILRSQMCLILEQQVVHRPELALPARAFRRLAAPSACGCTSSSGKLRKATRTRPAKRSSSSFTAGAACLQLGHSKSPYSTTVTGHAAHRSRDRWRSRGTASSKGTCGFIDDYAPFVLARPSARPLRLRAASAALRRVSSALLPRLRGQVRRRRQRAQVGDQRPDAFSAQRTAKGRHTLGAAEVDRTENFGIRSAVTPASVRRDSVRPSHCRRLRGSRRSSWQ